MSRYGRGSWAGFKRCASSIKGDEARYKQSSHQMSLQQVAGEEAEGRGTGREGEGVGERDRERERMRESQLVRLCCSQQIPCKILSSDLQRSSTC